jgi:glycosyltransferase involved in cell wall biosynthesis
MSFVQKEHPTAKLVMVGDGPLMEELQVQARTELGYPANNGQQGTRYVFLGSQPSSVVRDLMYRASLLAAPSIVAPSGDTEGLPINLCEAQAIGLPIVAFRGPGVAEAIVENETALLADPDRDAELAQAICAVLDDPALAVCLAAAGRRRAEEHFSLAAQTARLEELYTEALG